MSTCEPLVLRFDSRARLDGFLAALQQVIDRHDIYRTSVAWEGLPEPVQVVWRHAELPVTEITLEPGAARTRPRQAAGRGGPADGPDPGAAAAACTWRPSPDRTGWLALVQVHHLLQDHAGAGRGAGRVAAFLAGQATGCPSPLPFRDFVAQARLGVPREEHERYFAGLLGDVTEPTAPFGLLDVRGDGAGGRRRRGWRWSRGWPRGCGSGRGRWGCRRRRCSTWRGRGCWPRCPGRDDVVFGTVLFGRMNAGAGADRVPGPFINTLPVRVAVSGGRGGARRWPRCRRSWPGCWPTSTPRWRWPSRPAACPPPAPLFTSLLNYRHSPRRRGLRQAGGRAGGASRSCLLRSRTNYPVTSRSMTPGRGSRSRRRRWRRWIRGWCARWCGRRRTGLVAALEHAPGTPLRQVPVLDEAERDAAGGGVE